MIFASPVAFWLLIPLALVLVWFFIQKKKKTPSMQFSSIDLVKMAKPTLRARLIWFPLFLKFFAGLLIIVALARPQSASTQVKKNVEGIDIMIVLDISDSMLIEDMRPFNRIEAAKEVIQRFVDKRTSDRIGVVIFAGESFTLVPLTLDYDMIRSRVKEITTAQTARIKDGTAIGVAVANGAGRLKDSTAKSRVMIFLTDGENNSGTIDPETGLEIAKGYGIKIYSIGLGKDGPTRIPVYQKDVMGNRVKTYQPYEASVNETLLTKFASDTGGRYYRAEKENNLESVFSDIDRLEKTKIDINKYTRYTELFPKYLQAAIIFLLVGWFLAMTVLRRNP